ncbi:MAG: succinate dehydrogenase assembly factor 2 [Sphingobium sp.]
MDREDRIKRLRFRAWHRGTREADLLVGSFFDTFSASWSDQEIDWFEAFLEENDVEIMAWVMDVEPVPPRCAGPMMDRMRQIDYVQVVR